MNLSTPVIIAVLIGVNALYVLAEFAAVGVRRSRIRQMAEEGSTLASGLLPTIESPRRLDAYIAVCQVGITLSSLILGAYGQAALAPLLAPYLEPWTVDLATAAAAAAIAVLVFLTGVQVIFGELLPKSLALQFPVQAALLTYVPMRWSSFLLGWFSAALNAGGFIVLRLLGVRQATHRHIHRPEEIDLLIAESAEHGALEPIERKRLHQALQMATRTAAQLMVPRTAMATIDLNEPPETVLARIADSPFTRLPVHRGSIDQIVGIVHARDVAVEWLHDGRPPSIGHLAQPPLFVPETLRADKLIAQMREKRSQLAIVIEETGGVAGLVTIQDVLRDLLGPVADEFKVLEPRPERLPDGRVRLPGRMRLHEAREYLGAGWEGTSATVGGHVIEALGHLPVAGERLTIEGVEIEVERVAQHAVLSVVAKPPPQEEGA